MSRRAELSDGGQLALFEAESRPERRRRYVHVHTAEELAAFERSKAIAASIRPESLGPDERLCPGGCWKVIRRPARTCGRRWCDAVRPIWGRTVGEIVRAALSAYTDLYGGDGRVLSTVLTCTRAFFDALPRAARHHQLGYTDRYRYALAKQGRFQASQFHGYLAKLARYLAKSSSAGEFLRKHHGERVYYVAPWLSQLSGLTMTVARICRRVWAARHGYCDMPKIPERLQETVERLVGPLVSAPSAP